MNATNFWDNPDRANSTLKKVKSLKELVVPWDKAHGMVEDTLDMLELSEMESDQEMLEEIGNTTEELVEEVENLDIKSLLRGEYDDSNVFFSIHAGAGERNPVIGPKCSTVCMTAFLRGMVIKPRL